MPLPSVLRIEPASQCNLACSHCPTGTVEMPRGIMSKQVFKKVIDNIINNRSDIDVVVLYHGGEPLLNSRFFEMALEIRKILPDSFIKTVSNGMVLNESNSRKILACSIDQIEFSLDGLSALHNQVIRKNSDTEKILNNIKKLINIKKTDNLEKPQIVIATTQFIDKYAEFPLGDAPVPKWLTEQFNNLDIVFKSQYAIKWPHMVIQQDMDNRGLFDLVVDPYATDLSECDHVNNTITIRSDGNVVPCCYDLTSKLVMGNILKNSLINIWNSQGYMELRNSIKSKKYRSICGVCAVVRSPIYLVTT